MSCRAEASAWPGVVGTIELTIVAWVIAVARDTRRGYFFALVADGVLLAQAAGALVL